MTPQSSFMTLAPLRAGNAAPLRALLATMNIGPGTADPNNELVPFGSFGRLHFARFVVLEDLTLGDVAKVGIHRAEPPVYLAFLGDFDGDYDGFLEELVAKAESGLRLIFAFCEGFEHKVDLLQWMKDHEARPSANYCNWVGRTVKQCREEQALHNALAERLHGGLATVGQTPGQTPRTIRDDLAAFTRREQNAGRLKLTPAESTPFLWALRHAIDVAILVVVIGGGLVTLPLTFIPLVLLALKLRELEKTDIVIAPRPNEAIGVALAAIEDNGVTNQFSAMGSLKPGAFRRWLLQLVLWLVDLTARVIYTRGRLARVHTIHFARWVYLDGGTRLIFASNYDGSRESYMDDFINKAGFGLNAVFSNGIGYPRTRWLLADGAKNEQQFKYFLQRHELPTEVWYNAHAGLAAFDLARNSRIREGIEAMNMTDAQIREWLALI
jgi:hypothetical protein